MRQNLRGTIKQADSQTMRQKKLHSSGRYPKVVLRAFKQRAYAEDFVEHGRFRMSNLRTYTVIEDENRKDASEGQGHFQHYGMVTSVDFSRDSDETTTLSQPGYVHSHIELLNPKFIFSCSLPSVDINLLRQRFGPWIVKIKQPRQFADDIWAFLGTLPYRFGGGVKGCFMEYTKGQKSRHQLTVTSVPLSYSQKPTTFSTENEFRFVVIATGKPSQWLDDDFLPIDLAHKLDYVEFL
jgi:hypothetical protein